MPSYFNTFGSAYKVKSRVYKNTVQVPTTKYKRLSDGVTILESGGGPVDIATDTQQIYYTTSPRGQRSAQRCIHRRVTTQLAYSPIHYIGWPVSSPTQSYDGIWNELTYGGNVHGLAVARFRGLAGASGTNMLSGSSGDELITETYRRLRPDLTQVSLPNFLLEIGEIKGLMRFWNSKRGLVSNVAGAHLNYSFGWKPFIGDIQAMISVVTGIERRLDDWIKSVGKTIKRRATVKIVKFGLSEYLTNYVDTGFDCEYRGAYEGTVTGHIQYRPLPIKEIVNLHRTILGLLDGLGVELNPRIIWDAIPFSFVVDWFLGIGGMLERFKVDTLELPIKLEESFLQYKETVRVESRVKDHWNTSNYPAYFYPGVSSVETLFHRVPTAPSTSTLSSLDWHAPNPRQLLLLLSLGLSRR